MTINFTRTMAEELACIAQARVASAEADALKGLSVSISKTKYGNGHVLVTLEFTEAGVDRAAETFARYASLIGLLPEDYGREITVRDERFRISGISLNRPKFPVDMVRIKDGKTYKLSEEGARRALGMNRG